MPVVLDVLLWAGLALSLIAVVAGIYNIYWSLAEILCPTHLSISLSTILIPARSWDADAAPHFYAAWLRARANFRRNILLAALAVVVVDSWRSHITGAFTLTGLWITIPATVAVGWSLAADARTITLLREIPGEMCRLEVARSELDKARGRT